MAKTPRPRYQPHPMLARERKAMEKLERETGLSFEQWVRVAERAGVTSTKALKVWLAREHGHSPMRAMWIAAAALSGEGVYEEPEPLVDALYSGARARLRPLHEKVVGAALALGPDVIVTACKTLVPIYRKFVFAELRPADGGVAVQLALGDAKASGRLDRASGREPGDRLTHEVVVRSAKDLDAEFRDWLGAAYEAGAARRARKTGGAKPPADLAQALGASAAARKTWDSCTPAMQRDWVEWIASAKQAKTRARRVATAIERLEAGKKRAY